MIKEVDLIERKDTRSQFLSKIELLDKVGTLLTLPNTELLTTKMVADYFEVDYHTIKKAARRNSEELESNGMTFMKVDEIKDLVKGDAISLLKISNRGSNIFTKRAVLNIGMLLRDSKVAKELRSQILNTLDTATDEQKTQAIDEEKKMLLDIVLGEDDAQRAIALSIYNNHKNRHIATLNATIEEQKPHVSFSKEVLSAEGLIPTTLIAKDYGMTAQELNKILSAEDIIYKRGKQWYLYAKYNGMDYAQTTTTTEDNGLVKIESSWTQKGRKFIHEKLKEIGYLTIAEREKVREEG